MPLRPHLLSRKIQPARDRNLAFIVCLCFYARFPGFSFTCLCAGFSGFSFTCLCAWLPGFSSACLCAWLSGFGFACLPGT